MLIRDMTVQMLKEIQDVDRIKFNDTFMAFQCGVSVETYRRWMKYKHFTKSPNTLKQIEKVIKEYHPKAS